MRASKEYWMDLACRRGDESDLLRKALAKAEAELEAEKDVSLAASTMVVNQRKELARLNALAAQNEKLQPIVDLVTNLHRGHINRWMSVRGRARSQFNCELCHMIAALCKPKPAKEGE